MVTHSIAPRKVILLYFDRKMIEAGEVAPVLEALLPMADTAKAVRGYAGLLQVAFGGYDDDRRLVWEIPEIRKFVRNLTVVFPYWFHFCSKVDDTLYLLLACLYQIEHVDRSDAEVITTFGAMSMTSVRTKLFVGMNELYGRHGLTAAENEATTRDVAAYMRTYER